MFLRSQERSREDRYTRYYMANFNTFYHVLNEEYATEIAEGWNVKYNDDHKVYVTEFNKHIIGKIEVIKEFG